MATFVEGEASEIDSSEDEDQYVFNLSYMKIGSDIETISPNVIDNTKDLLLKGTVIDGVTEDQNLINTPIATEITEDFSPSEDQAAALAYTHDKKLFRKKINELSKNYIKNYMQHRLAPISKKLIDTDNSLINTQLTFQDVSTSMKAWSKSSSKLSAKFKNLMENDIDFLPKINKFSQ